MTLRILLCLIAGWVAGGLVFVLFFHKPIEYLAPVLAFSTTLFLLMVWMK